MTCETSVVCYIVCVSVELVELWLGSSSSQQQRRVVRSVDGLSSRADIYVGLILDGFYGLRNISAVVASIKMQYAVRPEPFCEGEEELEFNPDTDRFLALKVSTLYPRCLGVLCPHTLFREFTTRAVRLRRQLTYNQ